MSLKNLSLNKKLGFGFSIIIILFSISVLISFINLLKINTESGNIKDESLPNLLLTDEIVLSISEISRYTYTIITTEKKDLLTNIEDRNKFIKNGLSKLTNDAQEKGYDNLVPKLKELKTMYTAYYEFGKNLINSFLEFGIMEANQMIEQYNNQSKDITLKIKDFQKIAQNEIKSKSENMVNYTGNVIIVLVGLGIITIVISLILSIYIMKSTGKVLNNLREYGEGIEHVSNQVNQSTLEVAAGVSKQASAVEEITTSITQLSEQSKQSLENSSSAKDSGDKTLIMSDQGTDLMTRMVDSIKDIHDSSRDIAKITKAIDEISFQTNLLALNAAVEAARAGMAGKGFAVVAEEVNNLSKRSSKAAKEIAEIIEISLKKINAAMDIMEATEGMFNSINKNVKDITKNLTDINLAITEQVKGIEQLEIGTQQIDQIAQINASASEENASLSEELYELSKKMRISLANLISMNKNSGYHLKKTQIQDNDNDKLPENDGRKILRLENKNYEDR